MIISYASHYNDEYFTGKKTYKDSNGKEQLYHGPSLTWGGFQLVAEALSKVCPGKSLLDIGCSGGDLAQRMAKLGGYDSYGVEISNFAVDNCVPEMRGRIALADITECPALVPYTGTKEFLATYDLVMATDLLEHIYEEDLDKTFDWMVSKSNRFLFFCVATAQAPGSPFYIPNKMTFKAVKGQPIPPEWEPTAVSGHVNVRPFSYWIKFFLKKNLRIRWDLMYWFQLAREMDDGWKTTGGWNMQTTVILEKI